MNGSSGALITAIAGVLTVVIGTLLGYFIKRTSVASRMTRSNVLDQQWVMSLVSVVRDDFWTMSGYAYMARARYMIARERLRELGDTSFDEMAKVPIPRHEKLERDHASGVEASEDDST